MMRFGSWLSAGIAPVLLAGCASAPTHLLTLDAVAPASGAIRADYRGLPIAIPAVHVPAALDRTEFVTQPTAGEAQIDDYAHWAAPLGLLAREALVRDLTARLPAGAVLPPGSAGKPGATRTIDVTILALGTQPGSAFMQVAYRRLPDGPVRQVSLSAPATGTTPAATAEAFARLTGQLADRLAADLG